MLISKENLAILDATGEDDSSPFALHCVKVDSTRREIMAANKHQLWISKLPEIPVDEYPDCGINAVSPTEECILLPKDLLLKAMKNIPTRANIKSLKHLLLLVDEEYKHLVTSDLDSIQDLKIGHVGDGVGWPDALQIEDQIDKSDQPTIRVGLSVVELEIAIKVLKKAKAEFVIFEVKGELHPVALKTPNSMESQLRGYLMPYKVK